MSPVDVGPRDPIIEPQHLGDGFYVSFDGYQILVAVNDHRNTVAAIEQSVAIGLIEYAVRIWGRGILPGARENET